MYSWGKLEFDVKNETDVVLLAKLLRELGVELSKFTIASNDVVVEYDERFLDYLLNDRGVDARTARDYMNYLRRLSGRRLNYDLDLEISKNKWMVKTVRLYVDYLRKAGKLDDSEAERLLKLFKLKNTPKPIKPASISVEELTGVINKLKPGLYKTILLLLHYSGVRLSEMVKMLREFDPERLMCFDSFCRYYLGWYRGRKRCDFIYFPSSLVEDIKKLKTSVGKYETVRDELYDRYHVKPKEYRKLFYRVCREQDIPKEVCNLYQSRVKKLDIGGIHYDDLTKRADLFYPKIKNILEKLLRDNMNTFKDSWAYSRDEVSFEMIERTFFTGKYSS